MIKGIKNYLSPLVEKPFGPALYAFLTILIPSGVLLVLTSLEPSLYDILSASRNTPWGIFTSIFVHSGVAHFGGNIVVLLAFLFLFVKLEETLPQEHQYRDSRFLGLSMFLCGMIANSLFLVVSIGSSAGASGVVYACEGVITGFAFLIALSGRLSLDHLKRHQLDTQERQTIRGIVVFIGLFGFFLLFRGAFLSSGQGVNTFVHLLGYILGFASVGVTELYYIFRRTQSSNTGK